jgi:HTH-type transcriptional regulator, glycine betaine synthesis regulator
VKRNAISPLGAAAAGRAGAKPLNPVEVEAMHLFVQLSRALGQPPSVAEIYGLLFVAPKPLNQDDLINRINLSKGSASQGLRYLLDLGAVRTVYVPGDRRAHYEAVAELRNLASRFLRQQVLTYFDDADQRLDRLAGEARKLSAEERDFALMRIRMLKSWKRNATMLLPILSKLLGGNGR